MSQAPLRFFKPQIRLEGLPVSTETSEFSRPFLRRFKISALAWLGVEIEDDEGYLDVSQSLFVLEPRYIERNLKIADLANDVNLHAEIEPGECCCGLKLEFAAMPLEAQIGHTFDKAATNVIMLDSANGIKVHCQTCNRDWPAFVTQCAHYKTREPVYCHRCMQDHVREVREHGCDGHDAFELESSVAEKAPATLRSIFSQLVMKAEAGATVFTISVVGTMVLEYLNFAKIAPGIWPLISHSWFNTALIGLAVWLFSIYRDEDKRRSQKLKARAVAIFIWAAFGLILPGAIDQIFEIFNWVFSGFGLA
jgi:hypothetical protein